MGKHYWRNVLLPLQTAHPATSYTLVTVVEKRKSRLKTLQVGERWRSPRELYSSVQAIEPCQLDTLGLIGG